MFWKQMSRIVFLFQINQIYSNVLMRCYHCMNSKKTCLNWVSFNSRISFFKTKTLNISHNKVFTLWGLHVTDIVRLLHNHSAWGRIWGICRKYSRIWKLVCYYWPSVDCGSRRKPNDLLFGTDYPGGSTIKDLWILQSQRLL